MVQEPLLKVDRGQRGRQLPHIARRRADQAAKLAIAPMRRCDWLTPAGNNHGKTLGIVAGGFHADLRAFDRPDTGAIGSGADRAVKIGERQVALVVGRENHSDETRPMRSPREISTLKPDETGRGLEIMVFMLKSPETKKPG